MNEPNDREVVNHRVLPAPRERVLRAFREPASLARWWGPEGFTNTFREFDFRPGGHWRFTMHGPDGTDYENHSVFDEVTPERIAFRHLGSFHYFEMTILLAERGEQTEITWRQRFETAEHRAEIESFVRPANEQNLDRLEAELARMAE